MGLHVVARLRDLSSSCVSIGFGPAHRRHAGIARLVWEQQTRIQGAVTDARCRPLTLLLGFIEAIEVAFPRDAPRIFLGVGSLSRQGRKDSHDRCDRGKGRKAYHLDSDHELGYAHPPPARKTQVRVWIFPDMPILKFVDLPRR